MFSVAGEMAKWLRALFASPEDSGLIPNTQTNSGSQPSLTPVVPGGLVPSSDLCGY